MKKKIHILLILAFLLFHQSCLNAFANLSLHVTSIGKGNKFDVLATNVPLQTFMSELEKALGVTIDLQGDTSDYFVSGRFHSVTIDKILRRVFRGTDHLCIHNSSGEQITVMFSSRRQGSYPVKRADVRQNSDHQKEVSLTLTADPEGIQLEPDDIAELYVKQVSEAMGRRHPAEYIQPSKNISAEDSGIFFRW